MIAALLLSLQVVAASFLAYGPPAHAAVDIFGNPLCVTGAAHENDPARHSGHKNGLDCCLLACATHMQALATLPRADVAAHAPLVMVERLGWALSEVLPAKVEHDPGYARAPPAG